MTNLYREQADELGQRAVTQLLQGNPDTAVATATVALPQAVLALVDTLDRLGIVLDPQGWHRG